MKINRTIPYILSFLILILSLVAVNNNNDRVIKNNQSSLKNNASTDMKGIWVSYITLDMQSSEKTKEAFEIKINSIIKKTKESGFNTLIFQVRPFSDALYNSKYYPWSHTLTGAQGNNPEYDPLEIICDMCHKNNISVHAWINPYRVSTNNTPKSLSEDNPYVKDKSIGFVHNNSVYLDPSNEKAQKLIVNGVSEIVRNYDVDGIQFDDYFYPQDSDDVDDDIYNKYKSTATNSLTKEKWRAENVNKLIKSVYNEIKRIDKDVVFGISPQGNINNNLALGADVKTWCQNYGYIDYICPQIYFSLDNPSLTFEEGLNQWLEVKKHDNLKLYIGLAGYKGGTDEDEGTWLDNDDILKTEVEICEEKNTDGIMLYSYESFSNKDNQQEIKNVVNHITGINKD